MLIYLNYVIVNTGIRRFKSKTEVFAGTKTMVGYSVSWHMLTYRLELFVVTLNHDITWIFITRTLEVLKSQLCLYDVTAVYTGSNRRNGPDFGRVFLMLNYTEKPQNIYIQSWTVSEIMASEVWNFDSCYTLTDYQIHTETGRNMWFL